MTTPRRKVIIDCDTGVDDALALVLCLKNLEVASRGSRSRAWAILMSTAPAVWVPLRYPSRRSPWRAGMGWII